MNILEVSAAEYKEMFGRQSHVFNSVEFSELNKGKVASLHYLAFADTKVRFGLTLGERADGLYSPFSAPFGGFVECAHQRLGFIDEAVSALSGYGRAHGKPVYVTLPPLVYDCSQLSKWVNVFMRRAVLRHVDLNYHFDLSLFPHYEEIIERNARKNLHRARHEDLVTLHLDTSSDRDVERAYSVIKANREQHGYPLRMSLEAVKETVKIVDADFFVMTHGDKDVAAAQVFVVADGVAQVIYWGDLKEYSALRTMNGFACDIFSYYHSSGFKTLDIGPSTENGQPSYGLCDFKEGIGCGITPKFAFEL